MSVRISGEKPFGYNEETTFTLSFVDIISTGAVVSNNDLGFALEPKPNC